MRKNRDPHGVNRGEKGWLTTSSPYKFAMRSFAGLTFVGSEHDGSDGFALQSGRTTSLPTQSWLSIKHHNSSSSLVELSGESVEIHKIERGFDSSLSVCKTCDLDTIKVSSSNGICGHNLVVCHQIIAIAFVLNVKIPVADCCKAVACAKVCQIVRLPPVVIHCACHLKQGLIAGKSRVSTMR